MANNRDFTLKRKNGTIIDTLYPTTRWAQVEEKPTTFTPTAHTHGNITNGGAIGSVPNLMIKTGTSGKLTALSAGTTSQFLRGDGTWATPADTTTLTSLGITATAAELNVLDGITASTAELNVLDGITASTAELNYTDGVTSNIQTQLNSKAEPWKLIRSTEIAIPTALTANNVTVVSGNYYGKTLAFEVRVNTNNDTYETQIVFARMGSSNVISSSPDFDRFYGWSAFDGRYLKNHSFKAYCSNATSTTITVGAIKHLVGYFLNNTIEWTTPTIPTYIERIWLVN